MHFLFMFLSVAIRTSVNLMEWRCLRLDFEILASGFIWESESTCCCETKPQFPSVTPHVLLDCWKYVDGFWRLVEMLLSHLTSDVLIAHFSPAAFTIYCVVESPEMSTTVVFSKLSGGQETQTHSGSRCIVWGWKLNKTMWRRKDDIQPWCQWVFISAAAFKMKE